MRGQVYRGTYRQTTAPWYTGIPVIPRTPSSSTLLLARPSATNTTTRIDDLMICVARHRTLIRLTSKIVKNVENVFNT